MKKYLALIAVLCLGAPAYAADNVLMERMTSYEIRDAIAAGKTTVILPSGGTEQNGPNMAIGKHNFRVLANAQTIAHRLGNALVAPVIVYTPEGKYDPPTGPSALSRHHGRAGRCLCRRGGRRLPQPETAWLPGYRADRRSRLGPGRPEGVAAKLNTEWAGSGVRVHAISVYYRGDQAGDAAEMMKSGIKKEEIGNHSDVRDVSLMMAIDPPWCTRTGWKPATARTGWRAIPAMPAPKSAGC